MEIKMQKRNDKGKLIIKSIPKDISAFYKNAGWEFVKQEKTIKENEGKLLSNKKGE